MPAKGIALLLGVLAMSPQSPQSPPRSPELEQFIFGADKYNSAQLPRRMTPEFVASFLAQRMQPSDRTRAWLQAEQLADFYDLQEACPVFRRLLTGKESSAEEIRRAAIGTRVLAILGTAQDHDIAQALLNRLAEKAGVISFGELVTVLDALGPIADSQPLRSAIVAKLRQTPPGTADSTELDELNGRVTRADEANRIKVMILRAPRPQRVAEEVNIYLQIRLGYPEYLPAWAARRLRRETWAAEPAEQVQRHTNPARAYEVAGTFRNALPLVAQIPELTPEIREMKRNTVLRAIEFFGGVLTTEEARELAASPHKQFDVLSRQ